LQQLMKMPGKTYLITGANRGSFTSDSGYFNWEMGIRSIDHRPGIGRGMFDLYVAQPNNTLIAAVRNPEAAQGLLDVPRGENTNVIIVKIDSASKTNPFDAIRDIQAQGISHIDVVISAAGIAPLNTVEDIPLEEFEHVLQVNAISVMLLYKATLPLLRKALQPARFAFISAAGGSLTKMQKYPYPNVSYAGSKSLANVMVVKMGMENDWLITLCIHPG
jgi:norsolorinic acid ketoreductase